MERTKGRADQIYLKYFVKAIKNRVDKMNKISILCIIGIVGIVGMTLFMNNMVGKNADKDDEPYIVHYTNATGYEKELIYTDDGISVSTYNYSFAIGEDMAIVNRTIYCQNITGDVYGC